MLSHPYCDPIPEGQSPFHRLTRAVWLVCAVGTSEQADAGLAWGDLQVAAAPQDRLSSGAGAPLPGLLRSSCCSPRASEWFLLPGARVGRRTPRGGALPQGSRPAFLRVTVHHFSHTYFKKLFLLFWYGQLTMAVIV